MSKKRLLLLSGGALIALLLIGLVGVSAVSAQEPTPESEVPFRAGPLGWRGGGPERGGFFGMGGSGRWTMFDTAAEALGLTPVEFFTELHEGKSLDEIAEEQGIEMDAVRDAIDAARDEALQQAIEQAVEDGNMTQERADWMLEGLEQGFLPRGRGFGRGRGWGRGPRPEGE